MSSLGIPWEGDEMDIINEFETADIAVILDPSGIAILTFVDTQGARVAIQVKRNTLDFLATRIRHELERVPSPSRSLS
jgi:hypothetical protein